MGNQKRFVSLPILATIILVIALGAAGYFVYYKKSSLVIGEQNPQSEKSAQTNTQLKTYTNSQYGFSIQYPSDWVVEPTLESRPVVLIHDSKKAHYVDIWVYTDGYQVEAIRGRIENSTSVDTEYYTGTPKTNINIDRIEYPVYEYVGGEGCGDANYCSRFDIYVPGKRFIYKITSSNTTELTTIVTDLYKNILSTFRFTQ